MCGMISYFQVCDFACVRVVEPSFYPLNKMLQPGHVFLLSACYSLERKNELINYWSMLGMLSDFINAFPVSNAVVCLVIIHD